jgi:hypothetical protein
MRQSLYIAFITVVVLSACTTHKMGNVIPAENNLYQVISVEKTEEAALASALYSAETTCKQRQLRHIVLSHKTEYKGIVSAEAGETIEKVLEIILSETGKKAPDVSGANDYRTTLPFKCASK